MKVLEVDQATYAALSDLTHEIVLIEKYDFRRAVAHAREGLLRLGFDPDELLYQHVDVRVKESYWKRRERVLEAAARLNTEQGFPRMEMQYGLL